MTRRPRAYIIATFAVISMLLGSNGSEAADLDLISTFKSYLEKRPVAVDCAFRKQLNLKGIPDGAQDPSYFFRWQADSYYVQVIGGTSDIEHLQNGTIVGGRSGRDIWERHDGQLTVMSLDSGSTGLEKNPVWLNHTILDKTVNLVMDLGVVEKDQKTVKWINNTLHLSDEANRLVVGSLVEKTKGVPHLMGDGGGG